MCLFVLILEVPGVRFRHQLCPMGEYCIDFNFVKSHKPNITLTDKSTKMSNRTKLQAPSYQSICKLNLNFEFIFHHNINYWNALLCLIMMLKKKIINSMF